MARKKAERVRARRSPMNARELDAVIAGELFGLEVVGWWYTYYTDEDGKHVCDQEPENWWTGTSEKEPVYVNHHYPTPKYAEPKQIVFGYYHHNLRPVPDYSRDWGCVGGLISAIFEKGWDAEIASYSKGGKIKWRANVRKIDKQEVGATSFEDDGPMSLVCAIIEALKLKGGAKRSPQKKKVAA